LRQQRSHLEIAASLALLAMTAGLHFSPLSPTADTDKLAVTGHGATLQSIPGMDQTALAAVWERLMQAFP